MNVIIVLCVPIVWYGMMGVSTVDHQMRSGLMMRVKILLMELMIQLQQNQQSKQPDMLM